MKSSGAQNLFNPLAQIGILGLAQLGDPLFAEHLLRHFAGGDRVEQGGDPRFVAQ